MRRNVFPIATIRMMANNLYLLAFPSSTTAKPPPMINDAIYMTKETELPRRHIVNSNMSPL